MELLSEPVEPTIQGMDDHGWSNSPAVKDAPDDVHHEVTVDVAPDPGWSNVSLPKAQVRQIEESQSPVTEPEAKPAKKTARRSAKR